MPEIGLSVMLHSPQTETVLRELLDQFEAQAHVHVNLHVLDWSVARSELNKVALYQQGLDVSEVGTTWVSDLVAMNALRPFSGPEMAHIGGREAFIASVWETVRLLGDERPWAIPWLAETYAIHYRKDLLKQAGIDETKAFQTHARIDQTAQRLKQGGIQAPVELPLQCDRYGNLHSLASWIWGRGGDFCSPDGKQVLFDQPAALEAMQAYFGLLRYLSPDAARLVAERQEDLFRQGQSAITFGTLHILLGRGSVAPEVSKNWGAAALPSPCFMGGSALVVWKHTRREKIAADLAHFLTSPATLARCARPMAALPSRQESLSMPEFMNDPILSVMIQALKGGRSYPHARLWGMVEEKLVVDLLQIGSEILVAPEADVQAIIHRYIKPLAKRLNMSLAQTT